MDGLLRAELGVPPGKRGEGILRVAGADGVSRLAGCSDLIALLAKMEKVEVRLDDGDALSADNVRRLVSRPGDAVTLPVLTDDDRAWGQLPTHVADH